MFADDSIYCETCCTKICWDCMLIIDNLWCQLLISKYQEQMMNIANNISYITMKDRCSYQCITCKIRERKLGKTKKHLDISNVKFNLCTGEFRDKWKTNDNEYETIFEEDGENAYQQRLAVISTIPEFNYLQKNGFKPDQSHLNTQNSQNQQPQQISLGASSAFDEDYDENGNLIQITGNNNNDSSDEIMNQTTNNDQEQDDDDDDIMTDGTFTTVMVPRKNSSFSASIDDDDDDDYDDEYLSGGDIDPNEPQLPSSPSIENENDTQNENEMKNNTENENEMKVMEMKIDTENENEMKGSELTGDRATPGGPIDAINQFNSSDPFNRSNLSNPSNPFNPTVQTTHTPYQPTTYLSDNNYNNNSMQSRNSNDANDINSNNNNSASINRNVSWETHAHSPAGLSPFHMNTIGYVAGLNNQAQTPPANSINIRTLQSSNSTQPGYFSADNAAMNIVNTMNVDDNENDDIQTHDNNDNEQETDDDDDDMSGGDANAYLWTYM